MASKKSKNPRKLAKKAAKQKKEDDKVWEDCKSMALNGHSLEVCTAKVVEMEEAIVEIQAMLGAYSTRTAIFGEDGKLVARTTLDGTRELLQMAEGMPSEQQLNELLAEYKKQLQLMKTRIKAHGLFDEEKNKDNKKFDGGPNGDDAAGGGGGSGLMV